MRLPLPPVVAGTLARGRHRAVGVQRQALGGHYQVVSRSLAGHYHLDVLSVGGVVALGLLAGAVQHRHRAHEVDHLGREKKLT